MSSAKIKSFFSNHIKQIVTTIIALVVLVIIFVGVLPSLGNYQQAFDEISGMQNYQIVMLGLFTIINILVYVLPYMAALPKLRFLPGFVLRQTSFLISNSVPAGGALGVGVQAAMLQSYGFSSGATSSAIVLTGAWNILATISLPGVAAIGLLVTGQLDFDSAGKAVVSIVIASVSLLTFTLIIKSEVIAKKVGTLLDKLVNAASKLIKSLKNVSLSSQVMDFRKESYDVSINRWKYLAGSNLLQQMAQFSILFVSLYILEPGSISLASALWVYAIARLGSFIPLTPGGIGTVDAIMISLLSQAGVSSDIALASVLIWRFATFFPQIVIGILTFIYWRVVETKKQVAQNAETK